MTAPTLAALLSCLLAAGLTAAITMLGLALVRAAAQADARAPSPHPAPNAPSSTPATDAPAPARALDASEIRARILADTWHREGRLSAAGYRRLCNLMYAGEDAYPYWSGGELYGTAVVWAPGPDGRERRVTVAEWNAQAAAELLDGAQGEGVQLDASAREGTA